MSHGHFIWNELTTRNAEAAVHFYKATLGWTFEAMPMEGGGTYYTARDGEAYVAGIFTMEGAYFEGVPEHWFSYIEVDDVDRRAALFAEAGGCVARAPWDIPNVGRIAVVQDAGGAYVGLMKPIAR